MDDEQISRWALQAAARELVGSEGVAFCKRKVLPGVTEVPAMVATVNGKRKAFYSNLFTCSSVWMCPICSAKISERRRVELTTAIEKHPELVPVLATFTLSHTRGDKLPEVLGALLAAYRQLKSGRWWADFEKRYGCVGSVRGLEVTFGVNAFHPHIHVLFFFRRGVSLESLLGDLKARWKFVLQKQGRGASWDRGVDVRFANADIANYVNKYGEENAKAGAWGIEHELVKSPVKISKRGGKSPMQLLGEFYNGDKKSGYRWREYALTFKGKNALVWSRGLRDALGLGAELSNKEIAEREEEHAKKFAGISLAQWKKITRYEVRGELLKFMVRDDEVGFWKLVNAICGDEVEV